MKPKLAAGGMLWASWPKKAAKLPTDLDENVVRRIGLDQGLVDVKVAAVDEVWSGLKFVYRLKDRPEEEPQPARSWVAGSAPGGRRAGSRR